MTIGRIAGPSLKTDLDRQGVDLQFSTDGSPLLYLDFANFKASINGATSNETFTVNGSAKLGNLVLNNTTITSASNITLAASGDVSVGDVAKLKILGGAPNQIMITDGSGNLTWGDIGALSQSVNLTGMQVNLGTPTDGSLTVNAAYKNWTSTTTVTDAVDILNQVMLNVYENTFVNTVDFTASTVGGPNPLTVTFTPVVIGNANQFVWDFGDGTPPVTITSVNGTVSHTFTNPVGGLFTVSVTASNTLGIGPGSFASAQKVDYITLYTTAPVPLFTLSATSINNGTSVTLTNTSTDATSYQINWGDGQITNVTSNTSVGGPSGAPITHTYTNVGADTKYSLTLAAHSVTAGPTGLTITSSPTTINVFNTQLPTFTQSVTTGNNQHTVSPHGLTVTFTNTTATMPGPASVWPLHKYQWIFGDGTIVDVPVGSNAAGDTNLTISHTYTLADPTIGQTFSVTLKVYTGNTNSPFTSSTLTVNVLPAPTATFTGTANTLSDKVGDTAQVGYLFTDLNGNNRAIINFNDTSINTTSYQWAFGDGNTSTDPSSVIQHTYSTAGVYSVTLVATGPNSVNGSDDTLVRNNYISIYTPPPAPASLSTKTLSITSTGSTPLLAANATINTPITPISAGIAVPRIGLNDLQTNTLTNVYNASSGTLSALVNGVSVGSNVLTALNDVGIYGDLQITEDKDAHSVDATLYPSNFYKVFSGGVQKSNATIPVGLNSVKLSHTVTGSTNELQFVKDTVLNVPTISMTSATASVSQAGTLAYVSGIPYFTSGGQIIVSGVSVTDWIGQTYVGLATPMAYTLSSVPVSTQTLSYTQLQGASAYLVGGVPMAETGSSSPYTFGNFTINITGTATSPTTLNFRLTNVNGTSVPATLPVVINIAGANPSWVNELSIPVSPTLGSGFTDNGARIAVLTLGSTPDISSTANYYTTSQFNNTTVVENTDEAIVRYGVVVNDTTNYSTAVPPGPDLSTRSGSQYFRFAFRRTVMANFTVNYSGRISGLKIAAPGTQIDNTSTLNKWLTAELPYAGAGIPGANTAVGGNGSNGCAKTAGDMLPIGQTVTNKHMTLTLGSENASNAFANEILVCVELAPGDMLTSISIT